MVARCLAVMQVAMDDVLQQPGLDESAHTMVVRVHASPRIEVITRGERRRVWTLEQKREIVAESLGRI